MDLDTMTNVVLNNQYSLHEEDPSNGSPNRNNGNNKNNKNNKNSKNKKGKNKRTPKQKIFLIFKILIVLIILGAGFLYVFFKTSIFQKYKELWVQTAMTTMSHQYLATWFLSQEEIDEIMKKLEVTNTENSNSNNIDIQKNSGNVTVEKITGSGYVGYVMTIPDASKVKLVDGRKSSRGSKLSEIVKENNAVAGINAGGFVDEGGVGAGNVLGEAVIMNKKLLFGNKTSRYSLIGLNSKGILTLGKYKYNEAMDTGIESAVEFGPYLIVNGKNQISNSNSGGIQPRTAIGQKKDGTFIFVVVDGRQVGYSMGTTLLELQKIFEKYDAYNAANLDGGSSSTMYNNGKVVNKTSTPMGERYLPNAFIVGK